MHANGLDTAQPQFNAVEQRETSKPMQLTKQRTVITIGNFDGVHLGHQLLVRTAVRRAREEGGTAVAVTFDPHPVSFFRGLNAEEFRLQPPEARDALLESLGIDRVDRMTFDATLTAMSPAAFADALVHRHEGLGEVHVGHDFRFGAHRAGDTATLRSLGVERGFDVVVHEAVRLLDAPVSSSRVRDALRLGDMALAEALLGRPYAIAGEIAPGHGRGRVLGVPTLNLYPTGHLLPAPGVFVATISAGEQHIPAVANLGVRPTFADDPRVSLEAHALRDFAPMAGEVSVALHAHLRPEQRFDDPAALRTQIGHDIEAALAWHAMTAR